MAPALGTRETDFLLGERQRHERIEVGSEMRKLLIAVVLCAVFMLVELVGGYVAGSLAVMTDAAHLLSDLAGFSMSLVAMSVGRLPADASMTYGFARAEVVGALVSVIFIWALAIVLIALALYRLVHPEPVHAPLMFLLGLIGLVVNIIMGGVLGHGHSHADSHLHSHAHAHGHGHAHEHHSHSRGNADEENPQPAPAGRIAKFMNVMLGNDIQNINIRAAYLHVLGDLLQNVGVLVAAVVIFFKPAWSFADPLCTLLFAALVMSTSFGLFGDTLNVLMEGVPRGLDIAVIQKALASIPEVASIDDLHAWSLTIGKPALSVHLSTKSTCTHQVFKEAQTLLQDRFGVSHSTIQVNCLEDACCDDDAMSSPNCFRDSAA